MKYIRTKETEYGSIIDTIKYKEQTGEECCIPKNEVINQADTIEELCDEFVIVRWDGDYDLLRYIKLTHKEAFKLKNKDSKIYGAIWTDKGLIYVAKMNEKGTLELL